MLKRSRQAVYDSFPDFPSFSYDPDTDTDVISFPAPVCMEIIEPRAAASVADRFARMASAVAGLAGSIGATRLLFMGATATPWRHQINPFPPAATADRFLAANGVGRRFNGGFQIRLQHIPEWLPNIMWMVASNASMPEIYFIDPAQQMLGSFCRYGNLHLYLLQPRSAAAFKHFIKSDQVRLITEQGCRNHGDGLQEGRQIDVAGA